MGIGRHSAPRTGQSGIVEHGRSPVMTSWAGASLSPDKPEVIIFPGWASGHGQGGGVSESSRWKSETGARFEDLGPLSRKLTVVLIGAPPPGFAHLHPPPSPKASRDPPLGPQLPPHPLSRVSNLQHRRAQLWAQAEWGKLDSRTKSLSCRNGFPVASGIRSPASPPYPQAVQLLSLKSPPPETNLLVT